MKRVGLMCGREYAFPPAFIEKVNELGASDGVTAEFVKLGGTHGRGRPGYAVIVDRICHEVHYYRSFLKDATLERDVHHQQPVLVDGRRQVLQLLRRREARRRRAEDVLLPQKGYPWDVDIQPESLRNLQYPLDWEALVRLRRPAGHPQARRGRRLEARLQSRTPSTSSSRLRRDRRRTA